MIESLVWLGLAVGLSLGLIFSLNFVVKKYPRSRGVIARIGMRMFYVGLPFLIIYLILTFVRVMGLWDSRNP